MLGDMVELIPASERDEAIFAAWETGKGLRVLAREFGLPVMEIEQALDRLLPAFDQHHQLRAFKRELQKMEALAGEFYTIALRDKCRDSAHLVARLNERICAMRGWSAFNIRMDLTTVQEAEQPSGHQKLYEIIMRLARPGWQPGDGDVPVGGNGKGKAEPSGS